MGQTYRPFVEQYELTQEPWLPFTDYPNDEYEEGMRNLGHYVNNNMAGLELELACRRILRSLVLLVPHRRDGALGPSGLWGQWCNSIFLVDGFGDDVGLLYDDLSLALALPTPSPHWYTRLLAARDTIHSHWRRTPRGVCMCVCVHVYVCVCACVWVCVCG